MGVGDIVRTSCNFLLASGDQYQNVFHHIFDGIGGVSDATVVSEIKDWADAMYSELDAITDADIVEQLSFVDQVEWDTDMWKVVANIGNFTPAFTPAISSAILPNQSSPFVVFTTARPQSVGRKFLFPILTSGQDSGVMGSGTVDAIVAWADDAVNDIEIDVANVLHPGVPRTAVNDWLNFTAAVVTNIVGTQRRRRQGFGA